MQWNTYISCLVVELGILFTLRSNITSPLSVKNRTIYAFAWRLWHWSREGSLSCHISCDTGLGFCGLTKRIPSAAVSRLVQQGVERTFSNPGSTGMELAIYIQCRKTREQ